MTAYENARRLSTSYSLTPVKPGTTSEPHPALGTTYGHASVEQAHQVAEHQAKTYGDFGYVVHEGGPLGKAVWQGKVRKGVAMRHGLTSAYIEPTGK